MQVLLTGATGQLGKIVLDQQCLPIPLIATFNRSSPNLSFEGVDWRQYSLENITAPEELSLPAASSVLAVHFACTVSNEMSTIYSSDCMGSVNLFNYLRTRSNRLAIVFASSVDAIGPSNDYGVGKRYVEGVCRDISSKGVIAYALRIPLVTDLPKENADSISSYEFARWFRHGVGLDVVFDYLCMEINEADARSKLPFVKGYIV